MKKIATETLADVLTELGYDQAKVDDIVRRCSDKEQAASEEKEKTERKSPEYVIMVNDPAHKLPEDLTGWIVRKHPATKTDGMFQNDHEPKEWGDLELESRVEAWGREMASAERFKKWKFRCLGDYVEFGNKKLAKQYGLQFVTKLPVFICPVDPALSLYEEEGVAVTSKVNSLN